jgi:transposase
MTSRLWIPPSWWSATTAASSPIVSLRGWQRAARTRVHWFYGFKLHLIGNSEGEILACRLTPANVDDRRPVPHLAQGLFGKLIGDKGYLSQDLVALLLRQGVELLTPLRKNMKPRLLRLNDKWLLRKRVLIETINDQLKSTIN